MESVSIRAIRLLLFDFLDSIPTNNAIEVGIIKSYYARIMMSSDDDISNFMNSVIKPRKERILNKDRMAVLSVIQDIPFTDRINEEKYQCLLEYLIKIVYLL